MTNAISEDDIIKRRLLVEGDSGTDDRQINKLVKYFVKWCNSPLTETSNGTTNGSQNGNGTINEDESADNVYEQMLATLAGVEFNLVRNQFILEMNKMEQHNYQTLYQRIKLEIE